MYRLHTVCRACGYGKTVPAGVKAAPSNEKLLPVFDLGVQPLANDFRKPDEEQSGYAPLQVLLCPRCNLAQLSVVVRPDILYSHYAYRTSTSQMMMEHFKQLVQMFQQSAKRVLEIGSNDGVFLSFLSELGYRVTGIDPAENLANAAHLKGIRTITGLFNEESAQTYTLSEPELADVVVARHVFCHVDDWKGFIQDLATVTHKDSQVIIEVPWVEHLLNKYEYDTVYHEHLSYMNMKAMEYLLADSPFMVFGVRYFKIHGGAIAIVLRKKESGMTAMQIPNGDYNGAWSDFANTSAENISNLKLLVKDLKSQGKRIAGFGASAKATVTINAARFTRRELGYVMDSTLEKMYRLIPGTDIPILPEGTHITDMPDYLICFAWNYMDEILKKNTLYLEGGGKFIVPVPSVQVVP